MSRKSLIQKIQPVVSGPFYGRVSDAEEFMNSQIYAHAHSEIITREMLMAGAPNALVSGFNYTLVSNLILSIASGQSFGVNGLLYETFPLGDAHQVTLGTAHPSLPRIDLIYATLEAETDAETEFRPYVRLRTQLELEQGVPAYAPEQFNQATEKWTKATIQVRAGAPHASPVVPTTNSNEVPLFAVRVEAGATSLTTDKVTDIRNKVKSLYQTQGADWTTLINKPTKFPTGIGENVVDGVQGAILFVNAGVLAQDATKLFWDNPNDRLGIGTAIPRRRADLLDNTNPQLRLSHTDNSVYADMQVDNNGDLVINTTGNFIKPKGVLIDVTASQPFPALKINWIDLDANYADHPVMHFIGSYPNNTFSPIGLKIEFPNANAYGPVGMVIKNTGYTNKHGTGIFVDVDGFASVFPSYLELYGIIVNTAHTGLKIVGNPAEGVSILRNAVTDGGKSIAIQRTRGTYASPANVQANDEVGAIVFESQIAAGMTSVNKIQSIMVSAIESELRFFVKNSTNLFETLRLDGNTTPGQTGILILENGTIKRVTCGANDSGGSGFKYLRIAN